MLRSGWVVAQRTCSVRKESLETRPVRDNPAVKNGLAGSCLAARISSSFGAPVAPFSSAFLVAARLFW